MFLLYHRISCFKYDDAATEEQLKVLFVPFQGSLHSKESSGRGIRLGSRAVCKKGITVSREFKQNLCAELHFTE